MQNHHKNYQVVDVEAPLHRRSLRSEDENSLHRNKNNNQILFKLPRTKKTGCFCKCIVWIISLFFFLLIIIGITGGILYYVFHPKIPTYSIDSLKISDFRLNSDMTLYAQFNVKITAKNPNEKIGIYYEKGGKLGVWYMDTELCQGFLPEFYQGHQNSTKLDVDLTGNTKDGSTLMNALIEQQRNALVPLDLKVDVPVAIEFGTVKMKKVRFLVGCNLVVDSLNTNDLVSIKTSKCGFRLRL